MMHCMIAVVTVSMVIFCIDAVDRIFFRVFCMNKSMLGPVAEHHYYTGKNKWDDKYPESCLQVYKAHTNAKQVKRNFAKTQAHVKFLPFTIEEVHKGISKTLGQKPGNILYKSPETITLITQSTTAIIRHIILHMVHSHMMYKIRFRCMTKEWTNCPNNPVIDPHISFFKKFPVTDTMQH